MRPQISQITLMIILCILCAFVVMIGCASTTEEPKNPRTAERSEVPTNVGEKPQPPSSDISHLISLLGSDDWQTRESAQKTLEDWPQNKLADIEPALREAVSGDDPEVKKRTKRILKVIEVKQRVQFSETFLKEFPDVYRDLARLDAVGKFELLRKITAWEKNDYKYKGIVTNSDIAGLIGEVLLDGGQGLPFAHKRIILGICIGKDIDIIGDTVSPWYKPIPEAAPHIIKLLKDEDEIMRRLTIRVFGDLGSKEAIPEIMKLLKDEDAEVCRLAVAVLGRLGAREAIPALVELLKEQDDDIRQAAVDALGDIGAKKVIPEIIKLLKDKNYSMRMSAVESLGKLRAQKSIPAIIKLLKDENEWVRWKSCQALGELGAKKAISELMKLLEDKDRLVRRAAAIVLGKLDAKESISQLIKLLKDKNEDVRGLAAISLVELGAKDKVPKEVIKDIRYTLRYVGYKKRAQSALSRLEETKEE